MSYNPDTGIKDPHFTLKLQNSAPQNLRTSNLETQNL